MRRIKSLRKLGNHDWRNRPLIPKTIHHPVISKTARLMILSRSTIYFGLSGKLTLQGAKLQNIQPFANNF